jgi:hypothetical protein
MGHTLRTIARPLGFLITDGSGSQRAMAEGLERDFPDSGFRCAAPG